MGRSLRIQYPGAVYLVTGQGNDRDGLFPAREDYEIFVEKLYDSLDVYSVSLLGYVCLPDSYHLLLSTPEGNLSDFMRHFNIAYSASFNRRYNRTGNVYRGRYKSYVIEADTYLKEVSRYLHLIPVQTQDLRGSDLRDRINALKKYPFSSLPGYTDTRKRHDHVDYRTVLNSFGGDSQNGRAAYRRFLYQGLEKNLPSPIEISKSTGGIIGSLDFAERIKAGHLAMIEKNDETDQEKLIWLGVQYCPNSLISKFSDITGVSREELCRKGKNSIHRSMLMELLYRLCDIKQPDIGRYVGNIDHSAVSLSRKRLREKLAQDQSLKKHFENIMEDLSQPWD